jgi:flagellar L-ring protein precursor FlgH
MRLTALALAAALVALPASSAFGQDTFAPARQQPDPAPAATPLPAQQPAAIQPGVPAQPTSQPATQPEMSQSRAPQRNGRNEAAEPLYGYSLLVVSPPAPHSFKTHDLVTIVVDESSQQAADQSLNTDKKFTRNASVNALLDTQALAQLRLDPGNTNLKLIDMNGDNKFDGTGSYARNDKLSLKIQAEVIDVKPNGILSLEARKVIDKNGETQTTVLSGVCRQEDITTNNTVFSSQLANLALTTKNEGAVNDAGRKGIITKVLDALFAF